MSNMRVDIVTGPARYPRSPLLALVAVALLPVVGLVVLLVWSNGVADENEAMQAAHRDAERAATTAPDGSVAPGTPDAPARVGPVPALTTGVLSYRRAPASVAEAGDDLRLATAMAELAVFLDGRSCLSVSVDGRPVAAHNADVAVIPASLQKILLAAVALEVLGPEYRFTTSVLAPPAVDGVVDGDLYLVGGGDPLLVSAEFPEDPLPAFNTTSLAPLADAVVAAGITRVSGSVVGDGSRYDDEFVVPSWGPGVAFVEAGPYDALLVNDARLAGRTGRQRDPNDAAAREFARLLAERGVRVSGGAGTGVADPAAPVIGTVESAPLTAIVAEMLTNSDDDTAEMLLKELGVAAGADGTLADGLAVLDRTLRAWGVPMDGVRLADGSGLSPDNRVTCATLAAVLARSRGTAVEAGLPVAGRTGTLADTFVGTPLEGRLLAKTGTLGNPPVELDPPAVKGLAGYWPTDQGDTIEFVLLLNGPDVAAPANFIPYWTALGDRLVAYPDGPDVAGVGPR
jgi:D-alanyl-D-alanine carboxypeptidase/D-alanyl-D-alanine-endopeptidase (penicillin-binding protein 4)